MRALLFGITSPLPPATDTNVAIRRRPRPHGMIALALALAAGCGQRIDTYVEPRVTITSGVYGQALWYNDIGNTDASYPTTPIVFGLFPDDPRVNQAAPLRTTRTDAGGLFQLDLEPGDHFVCEVSADAGGPGSWPCVVPHVIAGELVRADYIMAFRRSWECRLDGHPCPGSFQSMY